MLCFCLFETGVAWREGRWQTKSSCKKARGKEMGSRLPRCAHLVLSSAAGCAMIGKEKLPQFQVTFLLLLPVTLEEEEGYCSCYSFPTCALQIEVGQSANPSSRLRTADKQAEVGGLLLFTATSTLLLSVTASVFFKVNKTSGALIEIRVCATDQ